MGSSSELGCCAQVIRGLLIIINILFGALGIVVFAIGIWAIVENRNFDFVTENQIVGGAALLIVAGVITMVICFLGIVGAIFKLRPILVIYAAIVFIIVVLEVIAGILAFVFRDDVTDTLREESLRALREYRPSPDADGFDQDVNDFVSFVQGTFDCCGVDGPEDWFTQNPAAVADNNGFPECDTCTPGVGDCRNFTATVGVFNTTVMTNATATGCLGATSDRLTVFFYAVGGLGIAIGVLEIVGILFALSLCCCITSALKQEVV